MHMKNENQMEFGEVEETIKLMVEYATETCDKSLRTSGKVIKTVSLNWGRFSFDNGMSIAAVVDFQEKANALLQEVKDLLAQGTFVSVSLIKSAYENVPEYEYVDQFGPHKSTSRQLNFDSWTFEGNSLDGDPEEEGAGLYLIPDFSYTEEHWDVMLFWKQDILKSLAEANL